MVAEMKRIEKLKDLNNMQIKNFKFDEVDFEWLIDHLSQIVNHTHLGCELCLVTTSFTKPPLMKYNE